uniref:SUMO interacting motifs containing 1 n=1 Tax=Anolis carolinensis TaxID=28377 RepID=A0A803T9W2_ANOCA|nr:PREDICTED: SUMO-interacting motif-containing protein 1 isoform X1 [Anolis carolinensis]|eukprot:XP_008119544.1 PREDICTED: SUMO-interacting motif-containing protein 1 isoform X1 [Anolis carolinensis]
MQEVIDLTEDDCFIVKTTTYSDLDVIDLIETENMIVSPLHDSGYIPQDVKHSPPVSNQPKGFPKILTTADPEIRLGAPTGTWNGDSGSVYFKKEPVETPCFQNSSFSPTTNCGQDLENSSRTTYNSDLGSLGSPQLESDIFSFSSTNESNECQMFQDYIEEPPKPCTPDRAPSPQPSPLHQKHSPSPSPSYSPVDTSPFQTEIVQSLLEAKNLAPNAVTLNVQQPAKRIDIRVWLKTLQYFQGLPVHHPFLQSVMREAAQNKQLKAKPIPCRKLSMVSSTIEENFFHGTLDSLMDYVSSQYYPPKEVTSCVVRKILLGPKYENIQEDIRKDAYTLLVKIQALHPAKVDTVVWDWPLLREVMEEEEGKFPGRLLFLQYVIQTLEDDFQRTIRIGLLHRSIAKAVLSCDYCSSNIKEVVEWLISAVTEVKLSECRRHNSLETSQDNSSSSTRHLHLDQSTQREDASLPWQTETEIALLQRMLSIAVEVDKSPNCSAHKIAHIVFSSLLNIPKRCQREAFLSSMECHLLRCRVLELLFKHSTVPTKGPLSLNRILKLLQSFSLPLIYQDNGATWQGWDEMLYHLNLLLQSYCSIILGHLRSPVYERINLIIKGAKPKLQSQDYIKESDVKCRIQSFKKHLSKTIQQPIPSSIIEKIELLQIQLLTALDI